MGASPSSAEPPLVPEVLPSVGPSAAEACHTITPRLLPGNPFLAEQHSLPRRASPCQGSVPLVKSRSQISLFPIVSKVPKPANEAAKYRNVKHANGPHSQTVCKSRTLDPGAEMGSSGCDPSDLGPTGIRCCSDQPDGDSVSWGRTQVIAQVILGLYWDF